ncbi:hypothetical protein ISF_04171 [Cordyceps fumosorosea ARSEF 2679]|uniref:Uncharacterized protein n=1 Tax=Cordyceps fumosorosea (strain ARSEF 2679) TaxID=1081104 RepID=A0A167XBF0_CORFA|nr:hypothetical protein ISF_04171 [Cordyceps fumosorosea ARSEF 2679]OAA64761.1 hypothetical protein ISF_04171 [Cordyceps fumosorosea ARSEF 2679]
MALGVRPADAAAAASPPTRPQAERRRHRDPRPAPRVVPGRRIFLKPLPASCDSPGWTRCHMLRFGRVLRGFSTVDGAADYSDLLHNNFTVLATALAYVVVVLRAMQVGLAVDDLKADSAFQKARDCRK